MEPKYVDIKKSTRKDKKMTAIFYNENKKKIRTIQFGSGQPTGKGTYLDHKDDKIKNAWIARHQVRGDFDAPMTASSLSRWILWNEPTLKDSIRNYIKKFNLKLL